MKTVVNALWHLFRYVVAAGISSLVLAILPLITALVPIALAILFVASCFLAILFRIPVEIDDPIGLVITPALLTLIGIASILTTLLVVAVFVLLGVLPVAMLTELISRRLRVRSLLIRLGGFLVSGFLFGVALASLFIGLRGYSANMLGIGIVILLVCAFTVFLFGFVHAVMSFVATVAVALWEKVKGWQSRYFQPKRV